MNTTTITTPPRKRRKWRKATWALIVWSALTVVWIIAGTAGESSTAHNDCRRETDVHLCEQAHHVGAGVGIAAIIVLGFMGFVVLALVWIMSRPKEARP